jgi:YteA family regulatory protein
MGYQSNDYYRDRLLREKDSLLEQIENIDDYNYTGLGHSLKESTSELSSYDNHPADQAPNTFEREKDLGLKDNTFQLLKAVDDALDKIETEEYGICECCGKKINEVRLEVVPYSTYCVDCKTEQELSSDTTDRPVEEDTLAPYGKAFNDDTGNVGFDAEDSWQAVARYGTSNTPSDINDAVKQSETYIDANEKQGTVDWADRVSDQGFTSGDEEFGDENILNWQPTTGQEEVKELEEEFQEKFEE